MFVEIVAYMYVLLCGGFRVVRIDLANNRNTYTSIYDISTVKEMNQIQLGWGEMIDKLHNVLYQPEFIDITTAKNQIRSVLERRHYVGMAI